MDIYKSLTILVNRTHHLGGIYELGSLLSSSILFLVGLISVSELEDLYALLNDLAVKTREDAVKTENIRSMER